MARIAEETWYYMPMGAKIRQDNMTSTSLQLSGRVTCDQDMLASITAEGPLAKGALPDAQAASEQGAKKLAEIFGEVAAPPKSKKRKTTKEEGEKSEVVKPKTMVEFGPQWLLHQFFSIQPNVGKTCFLQKPKAISK